MTRPLAWILLALASVAAIVLAIALFPQAFSIVSLDITMDRGHALAAARGLAVREHVGPRDFDQAASFGLDEEVQTFVELEGGGKDAFTRMLRDGLYVPYTWSVRHFREAETNEVTIRFTPDGRPYGFRERLREDASGAALEASAARLVAETRAVAAWNVDLSHLALVEQGQERRTAGRVYYTFTYERPSPTLGDGRYRLRLVVSGDRLTEVTPFVKVPEAFNRRYANMRSANTAIGVASAVGVGVLYFAGGIGVGLFFMLRRRYLLWHHAAAWGIFVALLQVLAALNELPLAWMSYDTALSRSAFLGQQLAMLGAVFLGSAVLFALSFMAAETLTRRAFGAHPQLWRVWARGPGSSTAVLGRTVGGLLLVGVFFAYDVVLYVVTTRTLGWWSPSEALFHPDVLAAYAPWLSAVANSFQAGFWEESLFRAVPLAGAALIGDRFGKRRLFLVIGFVVQALVFGAGHAPYPNQPAYARPVELLPSVGFGLLYVYFGLLPGIVLHFAFDVVWFALPIFVADAPGIHLQQAMVVLVTLVPLWVVLYRRFQAGRWTALDPADRNAAWTPPPPAPAPEPEAARAAIAMSPRVRSTWLALGALGMIVCAVVVARTPADASLEATRDEAAELARQAVEARGVTLGPPWRVMPVPEDGDEAAQEFVATTAGEARRAALTDTYLPRAFWRVRIARFEGDLADRAEEWAVFVTGDGRVRSVQHTLPEGRPGASLAEPAARALATAALLRDLHLDPARGQAREVSAQPRRLKARTDWTFTFVDTTVPRLPLGEPRVRVQVAGDEVAGTGRFVFVPEQWQREQRGPSTRNRIIQLVLAIVLGGVLGSAALAAVIAWSRGRFAPRVFLVAAGLTFVAGLAELANGWPQLLAAMPTEMPLPLLLAMLLATTTVAAAVSATVVGLVIGSLPAELAPTASLPRRDVLRLGVATGAFGAAVALVARWLATPAWARVPDLSGAGSVLPLVQVALAPLASVTMRVAIVLAALSMLDHFTAGWTRRRAAGAAALLVFGVAAVGGPSGNALTGWLVASLLTGSLLIVVVVTVARFDMAMVPLALGTMAAIGTLARGAGRPFPGAGLGAVFAAALVGLLSWWLSDAIRPHRAPQRLHPDDLAPTSTRAAGDA